MPVAVGTQQRTLQITRFCGCQNVIQCLAIGQLLVQINDGNFAIDLHRQVLDGDDAAARQNHRALHGVLQLAHVARPVIDHQAL